jgi:hypothetical protein
VLCLVSMVVLYRYTTYDLATKILAIFLVGTYVNEVLVALAAVKYHNNYPLHALYCLFEFATVSLYFNYSIDVFRKRNIGLKIGIVGVLVGICNIAFIEGLLKMNHYFLIYEGVFIIGMGMFSFLRMLGSEESTKIHLDPHFWFTAIFVCFWVVSMTKWSLNDYLAIHYSYYSILVSVGVIFFSMFLYLCFAVVFLLIPYLKKKNAE